MKSFDWTGSPVQDHEELTPEQLRLEALALGLRTADGIDRGLLSARAVDRLNQLVASGLATAPGGRVRPTVRGMLLADALARELSD